MKVVERITWTLARHQESQKLKAMVSFRTFVFNRIFPIHITGSFVYVDTLISYYKHQILHVSQCSSLHSPSAYILNQPPLPLAKSPMARCISSFSITARCKLDFALVCLAFTDDRTPTSAEGAEDDAVSWSAFMDVKWGATIIGVRRGGGGHWNKNHHTEEIVIYRRWVYTDDRRRKNRTYPTVGLIEM